MLLVYCILAAILGAAVALAVSIFIRKQTLKGKKEEIIEKAEIEADYRLSPVGPEKGAWLQIPGCPGRSGDRRPSEQSNNV